MSKKYIIQIQHLSKQYHQNKVFEDLNLQIKRGVTLVTGKNGAGKSTLLKMMIGLEEPTYGEITLFDNIKSNALSKKDKIKIGFQFQNDSFLRGVKVKEYINLYHLMYENSDKLYNSKRIFELLKINELENKYAVNLSGGQKKRLSLFLSVLGERNIIILDEPTAGIDIELKVMILEVIDYLKRCGVTIIVSSHDVEEFIDVCDELVILNKKVLFNGDKHCFYNLYNYKY
ncbi:ATP-binding cassette domain-containing protein, partial [Staphylococcus auricularis]